MLECRDISDHNRDRVPFSHVWQVMQSVSNRSKGGLRLLTFSSYFQFTNV